MFSRGSAFSSFPECSLLSESAELQRQSATKKWHRLSVLFSPDCSMSRGRLRRQGSLLRLRQGGWRGLRESAPRSRQTSVWSFPYLCFNARLQSRSRGIVFNQSHWLKLQPAQSLDNPGDSG